MSLSQSAVVSLDAFSLLVQLMLMLVELDRLERRCRPCSAVDTNPQCLRRNMFLCSWMFSLFLTTDAHAGSLVVELDRLKRRCRWIVIS